MTEAPLGGGVVGVGVDAVDVARFDRLLGRRPNIAVRMFTGAEQSTVEGSVNRAQMLAARFAAKEALMKSLGVGIGAFAFRDVEVQRTRGTDATIHVTTTGIATARDLANQNSHRTTNTARWNIA